MFSQDGYWTDYYGSIADDDFSLGGTDYFVHNAWVADPSQVVFNQDGYWTNLYGSIADDDEYSIGDKVLTRRNGLLCA